MRRFILILAAIGLASTGVWAGRTISLYLGTGVVLCSVGFLTAVGLRAWRKFHAAGSVFLLLLGIPSLLIGLYQLASWNTPRPLPMEEHLFRGVDYIREVLTSPEPAVVHIVKVDLTAPGVRVLVTPPDFPRSTPRRPSPRLLPSSSPSSASELLSNGGNSFLSNAQSVGHILPFIHDPKGILGGAASRGVQYGEASGLYPSRRLLGTIAPPSVRMCRVHGTWPRLESKHFIVDGKPITRYHGRPSARVSGRNQ